MIPRNRGIVQATSRYDQKAQNIWTIAINALVTAPMWTQYRASDLIAYERPPISLIVADERINENEIARYSKSVIKCACVRLTDRRSAASNSADRTRPCHLSMPPGGNQGQLYRAPAGPTATSRWAAYVRGGGIRAAQPGRASAFVDREVRVAVGGERPVVPVAPPLLQP
jgi:hypothetical protein